VKALNVLVILPERARSDEVRLAFEAGARFLLSRDSADADYPYTERVSSTWFKFDFPLTYWSDVLELGEVLVKMGYGKDARLANLVQLIMSKADGRGRWIMENPLNGKTWVDIEMKGKPSKWITLRALRVLQGAGLEI